MAIRTEACRYPLHPYTANYANRSPAGPPRLAEPFPYETVDCPPLPSQNYPGQSHLRDRLSGNNLGYRRLLEHIIQVVRLLFVSFKWGVINMVRMNQVLLKDGEPDGEPVKEFDDPDARNALCFDD